MFIIRKLRYCQSHSTFLFVDFVVSFIFIFCHIFIRAKNHNILFKTENIHKILFVRAKNKQTTHIQWKYEKSLQFSTFNYCVTGDSKIHPHHTHSHTYSLQPKQWSAIIITIKHWTHTKSWNGMLKLLLFQLANTLLYARCMHEFHRGS